MSNRFLILVGLLVLVILLGAVLGPVLLARPRGSTCGARGHRTGAPALSVAVRITGVSPGGQADRLGLLAGDVIESLNGVGLEEFQE